MNFVSLVRSALLLLPVILVLASVVHVSSFFLFASAKPPEAMFLEHGGADATTERAGG